MHMCSLTHAIPSAGIFKARFLLNIFCSIIDPINIVYHTVVVSLLVKKYFKILITKTATERTNQVTHNVHTHRNNNRVYNYNNNEEIINNTTLQ